ncbi:kelch-like [Perkinsus chesapeaki]|uniref:Kelch-like n=1 Tax=Perkinsus chesapeaki TaxID=330153 RepID=A0A7J6L612_PERCH|nr:kelch-like [Perkinsus chesapeaki]
MSAAAIPLGMPTMAECPLMIGSGEAGDDGFGYPQSDGVRLSGSEVVHEIVKPGATLPIKDKLVRLTTAHDGQSAALVEIVVSGGRTAAGACRTLLVLDRQLDTSTSHFQGLVQLDLHLNVTVYGEVAATLDELTDFREPEPPATVGRTLLLDTPNLPSSLNDGTRGVRLFVEGVGRHLPGLLPWRIVSLPGGLKLRLRQESVESSFKSVETDKTGCAVWECGLPPVGSDSYGVELGCGTGLVSLALAHMGVKMVVTDGNEKVIQLAERNMRENPGIPTDRLSFRKLMWGSREDSEALFYSEGGRHPSIVVGSDLVYPQSPADPLLAALDQLAGDNSDRTRVIICLKERTRDSSDFISKAKKCGWSVEDLAWLPELDTFPMEYLLASRSRPEQLLPYREVNIPSGPTFKLKYSTGQAAMWSSFAGSRCDHTGRGLWTASIVLSRYLWRTNFLENTKGPILDLGCGTGLLTMVAAEWAVQNGKLNDRQLLQVIGIDCNDETVELARENAVANGYANRLTSGSMELRTVDWSDAKSLQELRNIIGKPGLILGSDIIYPGPESPIQPLLAALDLLANEDTSILLSFRERSRIVAHFVEEAEQAGWKVKPLSQNDFEIDVPVDVSSPVLFDYRDFRLLRLSKNSGRPSPHSREVDKLIASAIDGVGSLVNETLLLGKVVSQIAGQEVRTNAQALEESIQKKVEDYLNSSQAVEQLGEERVKLIKEQLNASGEVLRGVITFLSTTSESSLESSIAVLNKSLSLMEIPIAILGPQAKRDSEVQERILSGLSSRAGSNSISNQSDPRRLIQFIRHVSRQRQERLSEYVDALLASGQLTKHPLVPHEFEKKLYLDILSIVTFAFENGMGSLDNLQLWGHAVKVRSLQASEPFMNLTIGGSSMHGREQLGVIVDSMLSDEFVNNPLIPDAVERSLYLNTVILIFRIIEDLSHSLHVTFMGHRLEWKLTPLDIAQVRCQKAPAHIKLNEEVIDRLVKELLSDSSINVFWIPDIIESAIYRNVLRLMLRVVEELLGRVELDLLGTAFSLKLVNMRDSSLWSFQAELEGDYYKSLAQVPTKELQERLYELQNEHEMIGRVLGARSDVTKVEIPPGNGNVEGCDLRKVEYGKGKFAVRAAEHPHVARCLQVKGLAPANIQTCYHIIADFNSYPQWMPWCTSARVDGSAKTSPLQFQCAVGFGIKHGGPTISDVVTYNVTLKPPDGKAAGIVAASEPFSYCETLVYDWTFEAKEKSTQNVLVATYLGSTATEFD